MNLIFVSAFLEILSIEPKQNFEFYKESKNQS
jgi:hypothetical protein